MVRIPNHIGVIPDGNRRWAQRNGLKREEGYAHGLEPGLRLLRAAKCCGVRELTFYGFTVDNCKRPKEQVKAFSAACSEAVKLICGEGVSLHVVGNAKSDCFPSDLLPFTERSAEAREMQVNFLVNYGWEWDMKNGWASREIPRVDLVMRWGGMCRLSGFLPLQTVYSDICVIEELWPDFRETQFEKALEWYRRQDVTLGG